MRRVLLALFLSSVVMAAVSTPAYADNLPYDHTSPYSTGCASTSYVPYSMIIDYPGTNIQMGGLELRFSSGCGTAWAHFYCINANDNNGCNSFAIQAQRYPDGQTDTHVVANGSGEWDSVTNQLYDLGSYYVRACWKGLPSPYWVAWTCTAYY